MEEAQSKNENLEEINNPLNEIIIDGYKYKYKNRYKTGFCYRQI